MLCCIKIYLPCHRASFLSPLCMIGFSHNLFFKNRMGGPNYNSSGPWLSCPSTTPWDTSWPTSLTTFLDADFMYGLMIYNHFFRKKNKTKKVNRRILLNLSGAWRSFLGSLQDHYHLVPCSEPHNLDSSHASSSQPSFIFLTPKMKLDNHFPMIKMNTFILISTVIVSI